MSSQLHNYTDSSLARIVEINGKKFCAGLWWSPINSAAQAKKEMNEQARENGMNLSTLYSGVALQAGFASIEPTQLKLYNGSWCLASILAQKLGESWIGAFDLEDGNFILIAVNEGRIVPGCDVVADYETIRSMLGDSASMYAWDSVFISDERLLEPFGLNKDLDEGVDQRSLKDILTDKKWDSSFKMRSTQDGIDPKITLAGIVIILAGTGFYGWNWYQSGLEQKALEQQAMRDEQSRKDKKSQDVLKAQKIVDDRAIKPTWPAEPSASEVLHACKAAAVKVPFSIAGWVLEGIDCTSKSLTGRFVRSQGTTMLNFRDSAEILKESKEISSYSVNTDKSTARMEFNLKPRGDSDELPRYRQWSMTWLSYFQNLRIGNQLKEIPHPPPPPPERSLVNILGKDNAEPPPPWWDTYGWDFSVTNSNAYEILEPMVGPGLVINKIIIKIESPISWKWSAQGEMHVKK